MGISPVTGKSKDPSGQKLPFDGNFKYTAGCLKYLDRGFEATGVAFVDVFSMVDFPINILILLFIGKNRGRKTLTTNT
jgi:hypothetical protein